MSLLLAHEWLSTTGGSENVFEQMLLARPDARTAALWVDDPVRFPDIGQQTWLARSPIRRSKAASLPLMPHAWKSISLDGIDRVVASSHAFAHTLASRAVRQGIPSYAYVYSPARYVWAPEADDRGATALARLGRPMLRRADRRSVSDEVQYAAISHFIAERMRRTWGVEAKVIYPNVDTQAAKAAAPLRTEDAQIVAGLPDVFVLGASRLVNYKRLDLVIESADRVGLPAVIVGRGEDEARLRDLADRTRQPVHFLGRVSDALLDHLYRAAYVLLFPAIEDFGIVPVEAILRGTPVVVGPEGGAPEIIDVTGGGRIASAPTAEAFAEAVHTIGTIDMRSATARAEQFSEARFRAEFSEWIQVEA